MANVRSDAVVFFGAMGDLAYKQIFPALQALVRNDGPNPSIIGVAKAEWAVSRNLVARIRMRRKSFSTCCAT